MSNDFSTLCEQADQSSASALDNLGHITTALRELQGELEKLPFFVRGFATSEIKRGTGQDLPAWAQMTSALTETLQEARAAVGRARAAGSVGDADRSIMVGAADRAEAAQSRLEALIAFMQAIPSKLNMAPPGVLPAERRAEFLSTVDSQTQALRATVAAIPPLAQSLRALGGQAA